MSEQKHTTVTQADLEITVVREIVKVLEKYHLTYKEGVKIIPSIEIALNELAFKQKINTANHHPK